MNIFLLDYDVKKCAEYHCDKHVVKMIVETAQMLCCVRRENGHEAEYKKTHSKHPCTIWAGESLDNYLWLCKLGKELCSEYTYRYGRRHKTEDVIDSCFSEKLDIESKGITEFAKAMPEKYKSVCPVTSYRNYYMGDKRSFVKRTKREKPKRFV